MVPGELEQGPDHICQNKPGTGTVCLGSNLPNSTLSLGQLAALYSAFLVSVLSYVYPDPYLTLPFVRCSWTIGFY